MNLTYGFNLLSRILFNKEIFRVIKKRFPKYFLVKMGLTDLLADLGAVIMRYLSDSAVAFILVILALMFHWIAALLVILMVAYVYKTKGMTKEGEIARAKPSTDSESLIIIIGAVMVTAGGYWLVQELIGQKIPASVSLILIGILLIVLGYSVRGEKSA